MYNRNCKFVFIAVFLQNCCRCADVSNKRDYNKKGSFYCSFTSLLFAVVLTALFWM